MRTLLLFAVAFLCMGAHCIPFVGCPLGETRCTGNVAQICDANGLYRKLADCDLVGKQSGAQFVCAYVEETTRDGPVTGHTCVPASEGGER